jgi:hypothetical protein
MNLLERRAMKRATKRLALQPGETVVDFDRGISFGTDTTDLVASDQALYLVIEGRVIRLAWSEVATVEFTGSTLLTTTMRDGREILVLSTPSFRPTFRAAVLEQTEGTR